MQVWQGRVLSRVAGRGAVILVLIALSYILNPPSARAEENQTSQTVVTVPAASRALVEGRPSAASRVALEEAYARLPLSFEENHGQAPNAVRFLSRGHGHTLFLTDRGAILTLPRPGIGNEGPGSKDAVVRMKILGGNSTPVAVGADPLPGQANYFMGSDPGSWRTRIPTYARVEYRNVYPGADLVYYGQDGRLEYDFRLSPGMSPRIIRMAFAGAKNMRLSPEGDLILLLPKGEIRFEKPVIYQAGPRGRRMLGGGYLLRGRNEISFFVPSYDRSLPLVVDPTLSYSTYLGGTGTDNAFGIAVDSSGNAYIAGQTSSLDFPIKGAFQGSNNGGTTDVFVTKLSPDGSSLVYSTYLGGGGTDYGKAIAVDSSGSAYVTGATNSGTVNNTANFPTTPGVKQTTLIGGYDAFVTKLSADGATLLYSTYLGSSDDDIGNAIAVDSAGNTFIAGSTASPKFPVTKSAFQTTLSGGTDAFFIELNPTATSPAVYGTFLGGSGDDSANGIAIDSSGKPYITGKTASSNFPVTTGVQQTSLGGSTDAFVAKLDPAQTGIPSLVYSTYLGGAGDDIGYGIALDSSNNAYIAGSTDSATYPATTGVVQTTLGGGTDAFISELNPDGTGLVYSTFLGGAGDDAAKTIALDSAGNAIVAGSTESTDFPTLFPIQASCASTAGSPCDDAFAASLGPGGTALNYSTYLGGGLHDEIDAVAVDSSANAYVAGSTVSTDFPTVNAFQQLCAMPAGTTTCGNSFVAKIGAPAAVQISPSVLPFGLTLINTSSAALTTTVTNNSGNSVTFNTITTTGNFAVASSGTTCSTSTPLADGASCTVAVTFTPPVTGIQTGTLQIGDNATGSPQTANLTGTGVNSLVTVAPGSLAFNPQSVGTSSAPQTVTLANAGSGPLTITSIAIGSGFSQSNTCGSTVAAGSSCTLTVTFGPTAEGAINGNLTISDDATGSPQVVSLSGTGVSPAASLSASSLNFGSQIVSTQSSTPQTVTLTNTGSGALSITSIAISGTNASDFTLTSKSPCGATVSPSSVCTISVNFKPAAAGAESATLQISDNAAGSPQSVALAGSGADFQISVSPASATVSAGSSATYTLTITPLGGFNATVALSCAGTPPFGACTLSNTSVTPDGSSPSTATVTVATLGPASAPLDSHRILPPSGLPKLPWPVWMLLGTLLLPLVRINRASARRPWMVLAATLLLATFWMACSGPNPNLPVNKGTNPGTYQLTLTGSSGNLGHSAPATLIVKAP
jgi:Abnormal spindle-like microcephaly-assoc'd, ASPM-SPD-2-Hydin/Beta-propeller repeat/Cep192 domain 4